MPKKKRPNKIKAACNCPACKVQTAIIETLGVPEGDTLSLDSYHVLAALGPTLAMLLGAVEYQEAENFWLEVLNERARLMTPEGVEYGPAFKGRA